MPEYFDELHRRGMKTVMILDPALVVDDKNYSPHDNALKADVYVKWPEGENPDYSYTNSSIMIGYVIIKKTLNVCQVLFQISKRFYLLIEKCWPEGRVAYPDFFKKSTQDWWISEIKKHFQTLKFDGLWIDMNERKIKI
jgi:alpha-glucosidase (family GH31 glycosyl hydrolase)